MILKIILKIEINMNINIKKYLLKFIFQVISDIILLFKIRLILSSSHSILFNVKLNRCVMVNSYGLINKLQLIFLHTNFYVCFIQELLNIIYN